MTIFSLASRGLELQVYASDSGIETGWAVLIALVALLVLSCGVRYARDDRCTICGHHLIWFRTVRDLACHIHAVVVKKQKRLCED